MIERFGPQWRRTPEPLEGEDSWKHSNVLRDAEIPATAQYYLRLGLAALLTFWAICVIVGGL